MGLANQELIEEMFYGRRALLEEIRGQRQENFLVVGPRKIGKTSLLQRVRFELEQQGYR
jgi:AAA+ ATPase superfamily predicted ATPase